MGVLPAYSTPRATRVGPTCLALATGAALVLALATARAQDAELPGPPSRAEPWDGQSGLQSLGQDQAAAQAAADYLKAHPGAGVPAGVQTGYNMGSGFFIRSVPDPKWDNKPEDPSAVPFELRIRGRLQLDYYNFHIINDKNYQTGLPFPPFAGLDRRPDFSALEVKRMRLIFEGTAFDPNLKYRIQLNGDTRGLGGFFNNNQISSGSPVSGGGAAIDGGGVTIDHAIRLFEAWVSYDLRPERCLGRSPDSPFRPCDPNYRPTYTLIAGKMKPFTGLEEQLGSGTDQFVEFSMTDWFFSPDDDNLLVAAGLLLKGMEDRFYLMALVTNGSESNFAASQLDDLPAFNGGFWYDFGGTWDESMKAWRLFGDSTNDIDHSENPVVRVGAGVNLVPIDRRRLYGDVEQSRFRAAPGGARLIDILNGAGSPNGIHAVDRFDAFTAVAYAAAKYRGLSIDNEWWVRYVTDFETLPAGNNVIYYTDFASGAPMTALFPVKSLTDYGMVLQGGYFLVPAKFEVVGRWSWINGESGNINGNGNAQIIDGNRVVNGAFRQFHAANEYTLGLNWFFRRHLLKWQTDVGYYQGGTPANASAAGFVTNADGWLVRTQLQLAF
jgi:hypothetical protein